MADKTFKTGDLAQLKSGGPVMTVGEVNMVHERATCSWFSGSKCETNDFKLAMLQEPVAKTRRSIR